MTLDQIISAHPEVRSLIDAGLLRPGDKSELLGSDDTDVWQPVPVSDEAEAAYAVDGNPDDGLIVVYRTIEPSLYAGRPAEEFAERQAERIAWGCVEDVD